MKQFAEENADIELATCSGHECLACDAQVRTTQDSGDIENKQSREKQAHTATMEGWAAEMQDLGCVPIFNQQGEVGSIDRPEHLKSEEHMQLLKEQEEKERKRRYYQSIFKNKSATKKLRKSKPKVTLGEFDLLFCLKDESYEAQPYKISHVEVSVKFLLYIGKTLDCFIPNDTARLSTAMSEGVSDGVADMFLGPHQGESLAQRRDHLKGQLQLSSFPEAKIELENLMGRLTVRVRPCYECSACRY